MAQLYRITPQEKKSMEYYVDVFERLPDGGFRGFEVTEIWRWGQAFRELDDPVYEFEAKDRVNCRPEIGWGCELDDLCGVYVNFDDDSFTEAEKADIEAILRGEKEDDDGRWGTAWIYDGDHNWEIETDHVAVLGPVKIDLVDEDVYNEIIEENVSPIPLPESGTDWPFPEQESK